MALAKALRLGSVSAVTLMYSTALARYNKPATREAGRVMLVAV